MQYIGHSLFWLAVFEFRSFKYRSIYLTAYMSFWMLSPISMFFISGQGYEISPNATSQSQESYKPERIKKVHSKLHLLQASLCTLTATRIALIYVCTYIRLSVPFGYPWNPEFVGNTGNRSSNPWPLTWQGVVYILRNQQRGEGVSKCLRLITGGGGGGGWPLIT